jgi:hypothetical protein
MTCTMGHGDRKTPNVVNFYGRYDKLSHTAQKRSFEGKQELRGPSGLGNCPAEFKSVYGRDAGLGGPFADSLISFSDGLSRPLFYY